MVSLLKILCFILLLYPVLALAKPSLEIELKHTTVEYGRPVYMKIIAEGLKADLSLLQLDALSTQFVIDSRDLESEIVQQNEGVHEQPINEKGSGEITRQILRLKMYPRQTGKLRIPAFTMDKISSGKEILTIVDASNKGTKILLNSNISSTEVWQREQILVSLTLNTAEEFATIKPGELPVDGIEITALPVKRVWTKNEDGGKSTITTGWSLLPLQAGISEIELPPIEYHLNGVVRRVFYLPKIRLKVRPLPSYLPPTIPVGKVDINSSIASEGLSPGKLLYTDDLAYWNISIESKSLTPYWLPPILRQIQSGDGIHFFPATSVRSMQPDNEGVNGRVNHTIPFKPLQNGFADIPSLKIQYFDPATGRLETLVHQAEKPFSAGIISRLLLVLLLAVFILTLVWGLYRHLLTRIRYRKLHQQAILRIRQAETSQEVVAGLRQAGEAEGWPVNLSLTDWLVRWRKKYQSDAELDQTIKSLALIHYDSENEMNLQKNRQTITTELADLVASPRRAVKNG
ncbi:MAG: hypothetical protein BMS9Abin25_1631 [Gammaproteobacteria bacterium]|nr:MAG: hypothetical protein BMS9Abin25_1631 [Gammaproteobacteria bacterium]